MGVPESSPDLPDAPVAPAPAAGGGDLTRSTGAPEVLVVLLLVAVLLESLLLLHIFASELEKLKLELAAALL